MNTYLVKFKLDSNDPEDDEDYPIKKTLFVEAVMESDIKGKLETHFKAKNPQFFVHDIKIIESI